MFAQLCKELDFPAESVTTLQTAYIFVTENIEVNTLFQTAVDSLLHPNNILFNEKTEKIVQLTKLQP